MSGFITIEIESKNNQEEIYKFLTENLPGYNWRCGDSDMQGLYISGSSDDSGQIQLWLDKPITMTLSLRGDRLDIPKREEWKQTLVENITGTLFPAMGKMVSINEVP